MPAVEFHILSETGDQARLRYACGLIQQTHDQNQRACVYASDDAQAKLMDELLWTFRDQAFIPHEIRTTTSPSHPRISAVIGVSDEVLNEFQILINLSDAMPTTVGSFARICEVVDADPTHKQQARERYKQYREQGCQLQTVNA